MFTNPYKAHAAEKARYTVCVEPVGLQTSNILWNDADQAAFVGAPAVSPFKPLTSSDLEWQRAYNRAIDGLRISGFTPLGRNARVSA